MRTERDRRLGTGAVGSLLRAAWSRAGGAAPLGAADGGRTVLPPAGTEAAELQGALEALARAAEPSAPTATLLEAYDRVLAADLLFQERFDAVARRLEEIGASSEIVERLRHARARHHDAMARVLGPVRPELERYRADLLRADAEAGAPRRLEARARETFAAGEQALLEVRRAVDELSVEAGPEPLRAALLPYGRLSLDQRTPTSAPPVVPSYLDPTDAGHTAEDLAPGALTPLSDPILRKAEELGYDYVSIFEAVRNGIDTAWYAGAMQGAEETLRRGRGNHADQAALLIALLRAAGAPARFVWGSVEMPVAALVDDLGLAASTGDLPDAADRVAEALRRAGVPFRPIVRGGRVAAFEVESVWVSARIPYTNYRGAVVDVSGATWLPLAPWLKGYGVEPAAGAFQAMAAADGSSADGFVTEMLAAPQVEEPMAVLRERIGAFLAESGGGSYPDSLRSRTLEVQSLGLLPSTLPATVATVAGESAELPADRFHRVRLVVRAEASEATAPVLDWSASLADLAGRRVTLSYVPATVEDHRTVNAFGGLHTVPLYLVRLRPRVMVDGRPVAVAEAAVDAGIRHRLEVRLLAPFGEERVARTVVSGAYYALDLGAQGSLSREVPEDDPADEESLGAALLARVASRYAQAWSEDEEELAALLGVAVVRPVPSVSIAGSAVAIQSVLGLPEQLEWKGVDLDAALRVAEPVAGATVAGPPSSGTARDWIALAALQGSALEHRVFQDLFLVDGISADKGLGLARAAGLEVLRLTGANLDAELPGLGHPASVRSAIENWVRLGFEVEVPRAPVTRNAWSGAVWRVVDPQGRGAGYFIAGALAGGATTEPPGSWVLDFLADALAAPYAPEPSRDPLAGAEVVKVTGSDRQEGTVGEVYPESLTVLVRDADGRPVAGAPVTFEVWAGGGALIDGEGVEGPLLVTTTNSLGLASARFRAGLHTEAEPVYLLRRPGDTQVTRALADLVEVEVASRLGTLVPEAPFEQIAYPGPPAALRKTSPEEEIRFGWPGAWAGSFQVAVEDAHGNPVSNVPVTFSVGARLFEPSCPVPSEFLPSVVFLECPLADPRLGDCGAPAVTDVSSVFGASAGVILGDTVLTLHTFQAASEGLSPVAQQYLAQTFFPFPPLACKTVPGTLLARVVVPVDAFGRRITAARAGQTMARPLDLALFYARPKSDDPQSPEYSRMEWVPTTGSVHLTVDNGGAASPVYRSGDRYRSSITTGPLPGTNVVTLSATGVQTITLNEAGAIVPDVADMEPRPITEVWGVLPRIVSVSPDPPVLGPGGHTTSEVVVGYEIEPGGYRAADAEMEVFEDGELAARGLGTSRQGLGAATIQRGFPFDGERDYELEAVLNRGSEVEVRSDRFPLPLFQKILRNVTPSIQLDQDVDLLNQRSCQVGTEFRYTLTQAAVVTLEMRPVESFDIGGGRQLGAPVALIAGEELPRGDHSRLIVPGELPAGDYEFTLRAVSVADGLVDEEIGTARSELRIRDSLPVGHTLIHGVDLWDGHVAVSRSDLSYPGRGSALELGRTYSSNAGFEPGALGVGWSHTYDSRVVVTPCGEAIVIGGEGSGMRFVDDGEGGLRPLKGYHGTLIANPETLSFDFYTKSGTRYRFSIPHGAELYLESITDPNGNTTRLVYQTGLDGGPRLSAVVDPAGRTLTFHYRYGEFALWQGEVLARVEGPDGTGHAVDFSYDAFGNLVRAEREGGARVESYAYATAPGDSLEDRHALVSVTDELDGATTAYERLRGTIRATGDIVVPSLFYTGVTLPEGGTTTFAYDYDALESRAPELITRVTDRRGKTTTFHLNAYGSPVLIVDPLEHETAMTWAADDVVMTSRTDANGVTTAFDWDGDGNLLSESVTFDDPRGGEVTLERSFTYEPPEAFDPPYLKERIATRTDRTGATTEYDYDAAGNLLEERITVSLAEGGTRELVTRHAYTSRGDRSSTTDPRGETTFYGYDGYGNLATVTDPVGAVTTTTYDERSLPVQQTDPLDRLTLLEYDPLGRLTRRVLPRAEGEPAAPEETWTYDDAANTVAHVDEAGRTTVTTTDLEGREVRIDNPAGGTKLLEYDLEGNKTLETGWFDAETPRVDVTYAYDDAGRLTERREPLARTTSYEYDPAGNVVRETLYDRSDAAFGPRVAEHAYDGLNRVVETRRLTGGEPVVVRMAYDGEGRRVWQQDPLGRQTTVEYDELGRAIRVLEPAGRETVNVYDGAGNRIEERRRNEVDGQRVDQVRRFAYDGAGRLVEEEDALGRSTLFEYDLVGNLLRRIDRRLNVESHTYDARNRRLTTTRHLTRVSVPQRQVTTRYAYDAVGNRVEDRWPNGNVLRHAYDALDRKLRTEDELGLVEAASYDARGNVLTETDGNGHVTTTTYDGLDRPTQIEAPEDRMTTLAYDVAGNKVSETDPRGNTSTYDFDRLDRLVRVTDPAPFAYTMEMAYDAAGNKVSETDRRGHTTTYEYDDLDRLVRMVAPAPLAYETLYTYDLLENRLSATDPRGIVTETRYDRENRPVEVRRAGQVVQAIEYDAEGNRRFVSDANGNVTGYEYDERNLLLAENRPLAAITRQTLDDMGDVVARRDPEGRVTTYGYDLRRRMVAETDNASETTLYTYDLAGNRTRVERPEENAWTYRYDDADRLLEVEDPDGGITAYTYDDNDNRLTQTDANGHATSFEYDELDRLRARVYPDLAREELAYDENDNRTGRMDPKGQTTAWEYDALDRETLRTYSLPSEVSGDDLQSIATELDPNGNPVRVTETYSGATGTRVTERTFDLFDRLETVTDPHGEEIAYAYDPNGNRTRLTDPDGKVTSYTFDALNRPTAVTTAAGVTEYEYLRDGRLAEVRYPNGTNTVQGYDDAGRTATIENRVGTTVVSRFEYEYDGNGNRTRQVEENGAGVEETSYAYDRLDRLTEVAYPDRVATYGYDAVGNRLTEAATDPVTAALLTDKLYAYDQRDRLESLTDRLDPAGSVVFGYDANGNQTSRTRGGVTTTLRYSVRDRLTEIREGGSLAGSYLYDHQGLRVAKRAGTGDTVRYVYDDQSVLLQTTTTGDTIAKYDYGPDRLLSLDHATEGRQFYLFDALGSVANLTGPAGAVEARYRYDAWGNPRATAGTSPNPFGFTGHERDDETGLYYAKARYYDPELGIFLTEDPFQGEVQNPPSLHRYLYGYQNPTVYVDPTGMYAESGHYYTVYYAALLVGYSPEEAKEVAFFAQLPDEYPDLDAIAVQGRGVGRLLLSRGRDVGGILESMEIQEGFHSLNGGSSEEETAAVRRAIESAGDDLHVVGLLLHRLGDSFAHRQIGDESRLYEQGMGHFDDGTSPDKVLRRPELYARYFETLVTVLGRKRGLADEALRGLATSGSPLTYSGRAYRVLLSIGQADPDSPYDLIARGIVLDYLLATGRVGTFYDNLDNEGASRFGKCLRSNECLEEAFLYKMKTLVAARGGDLTYEPEEHSSGLGHGILSRKGVDDVLEEAYGGEAEKSPNPTEADVERAVEKALRTSRAHDAPIEGTTEEDPDEAGVQVRPPAAEVLPPP